MAGTDPNLPAFLSKDFDFQEQSFEKFQSFIESGKFLNNKQKLVTLPCHRGWLITLRALKQLCETLIKDEKPVHFLCLRKFNQDHVENIHSRISAFHGFNDHPMRHQYVTAIKFLSCTCSLGTTELIDSFLSKSTNCAVESCLNNILNRRYCTKFSSMRCTFFHFRSLAKYKFA